MRWYQFPIELVRFIGSTPTRLRTFNCYFALATLWAATPFFAGAAIGKQSLPNIVVSAYVVALFFFVQMRWYWLELRPRVLDLKKRTLDSVG